VAAFKLWSEQFASASATEKAALLAEGARLAAERRAEMRRLITTDPKEALASALPYRLRKELPASIAQELEQPVSGRGNFKVLQSTRAFGQSDVPSTEYWVTLHNSSYRTYTYGGRLTQPSRAGLFLHGIALVDPPAEGAAVKEAAPPVLALSPEAGRVLEPEEALDAVGAGLAPVEAVCGATGNSSQAAGGQVLVEFGEKFFPFCRPAHAAQFNRNMTLLHNEPRRWNAAGFVPANHATETLPPPGRSGTQGIKKLLYIRVLFPDDPVPPQNEDGAQATVKASNQYFYDNSYGTLSIETTVTPLLRLPQTRNYYGEIGRLMQQIRIFPEAATEAAKLGYFTADYDFAYVLFNPLPQAGFGGRSDGLLNGSPGAITHEIGHNLGLGHAYSWDPSGRFPSWPVPPFWPVLLPADPDSYTGHGDINAPNNGLTTPAPFQDYGDPYDVMGSGPGHFGALAKWVLNWLPDTNVKLARSSTTNRIYAFDTPRIREGRFYAVRTHKDFQPSLFGPLEREYWASFRQGFTDNPWESGGIELHWNYGGINTLLDTTPESSYSKQDSAVVVGRTFSDPPAELHFTPIAQGGGPDPSDKWIDLVVQIGPFPQNHAPVISLQASALTVTNGATVTFAVTAQDPDGDALAYHWDFGDHSFGLNTNTLFKTFTTNGQYVVRVEVSDMKGGLTSAFVVVTVGQPSTFYISGRVIDIFGNPVAGARVHNSGLLPPPDTPVLPDGIQTNSTVTQLGTYRYTYTDSQGFYTIGNISPGNYTNRAFRYGYRTDPLNFVDPIPLTNGNANNADFLAKPLTRLRIERITDATENGVDAGSFNIIREGDLSGDLLVRYHFSGLAQIGTDFVPPPGNLFTNPLTGVVTTNPVGFITIPGGQPSTNLDIVAIDNPDGVGPSLVRCTLMLAPTDLRITTMLTNIITTNGTILLTNTMIISITNVVRVPGWEVLQVGSTASNFWFQTDPTYILSHAEATLNILDDDPPGTPVVAVVAAQVILNGETVIAADSDAVETRPDNAMLAFIRLGAPLDADLVVHYSLVGDASNGVDFVELPGTVTIPAGEAFVLVPVRSINDLFVEGNEEIRVVVEPDASYFILPDFSEATLVVVEDDLPLVSMYSAVSTAGNLAGIGVVTVSRTGSIDKDLLVNYLVTGTATSGQDFQVLPGSVVIPAGQLTADIVITPINNSTSVWPKTVTLLLSDSPAYNIYNNNSATVTIVDLRLPIITLQTVNATVNENGGTGIFTVRRSGQIAEFTNSLTVYFEVGGTAWEGADYAPIGTNVVIPAGSATTNITIQPINDRFRERRDISGEDEVIIQLRPGPTYLLGAVTDGSMRIVDDDFNELPAIGFMLRSSSGREDAGPPSLALLWVKCEANPFSNQPVQIEYRISGGSALPNVNYRPIAGVTGFLNFFTNAPPPPNVEDELQPIVITNLNDNVASGDKTFIVTLQNPQRLMTNIILVTNMGTILTNRIITPIPTNAYISEARSHTFTIIDVGVQTVTIVPAVPRAYEAGTPGAFILTRTGPTNAPLTVTFAVSGTAASGNDFAPLGVNGTLTIPAGTNTALLDLLPLDDPTEETAESVIVTLLPRPGYRVGDPGEASIILVSDDGTLQFTSAEYHVSEDAGPAVVSVLRTGDTNLAASVDYQFSNGTANNQLDFTGANGTVNFAPGETVKDILIPLVNDLLVEPAETFTVLLSNPSGGVPLGGQNTATVVIENDDIAFAFATNSFFANENALSALITVSRLGLTGGVASVRFATEDLTARASNDYVGTNLVLTFDPGITSIVTQVRLLNEVAFEGDETVRLVLSEPGPNSTLGTLSNATLVIVDDECSMEFQAPNFDVNEYAGFAQVVVHRNGGTVHPLTVNFSTRNGTASNGVDYTALNRTVNFRGDSLVLDTNGSGALTFQPGDRDITVLVPILDDVLGEGNELFFGRIANLTRPPGLPAGTIVFTANTNSSVTILDNETAGNLDYEFSASSGANARVRSMTFQSNQKVVFGGDFTTFNGIAFNRVARLQTSGLLDPSFNPGAGANDAIFAVAAQPDDRVVIGGLFTTVDGVGRVRIARLASDGNLDGSFNPGLGPNNTVRAIAVQSDGRILIGGEFATVNGVSRPFLARLNANGSFDSSFNASVNNPVFTLAVQPDGKILAGGAFTSAGGTNRSFLARLNSDGSADAGFDPGTGFNGNVNSIALQVDGRILVGGAFSTYRDVARSRLARLNSDASIEAAFNPGSGPNAPVHSVSVQPSGKVFIGGDFTTFNGADRRFFTRLRSDGMLDSLFTVGSGANGPVRTTLIQNNSAIMIGGDFTTVQGIPRGYIARVHGDEKSNIAGVEFASAVYQVSENLGPAVISVVRTGNTNPAFSVQFFTSAGTATDPDDYSNRSGAIAFGPGQTLATFSIPIVNDTLFELDESILLRLTNASNPTIDMSGLTNATLFIVDDEKGVQFSAATYSVFEEATNAVITIVRSGGLNGAASVEFRASAGTAGSGVDFIGVTNSLTFTNGESAKTILIPILDDNAFEPDETVRLSLLNPVGATTNTPYESILTIVNTDQQFGTFTFASTNRINIIDGSPGLPYPANITASGLTGLVSRVAITLQGLTHTFPDDIDMLLVSPAGTNVVVMSDAGGTLDVFGLTLRLEDGAPFFLPDNGPIVSGSYKPSNYEGADAFSAPAPGGPYGNAFAAFAGAPPNGVWSLYVTDDRGTDVGEVLNGWRLEITTVDPATITDLGITMTDAPDPVMGGNTLTYTMTVTNAGPLVATSVAVTNVLPANVNFVSASASQGTCTNLAGTIVCSLDKILVGATAQVTLSVTPIISGLLTNVATVGSSQADVTPLNSTATAVTTITPAPVADLAVGISDTPDPLFAGSNLTYTIQVTNLGPLTASGAVLTDNLPPSLGFVSVVSTIGSCNVTANSVSCNLGDMAAGTRAIVTLVARTLVAGQITNKVTATSGTADLTPASASTVTTALSAANLLVFQRDSADPVAVGGTLTYTIVITNLGVSTARGVNVVDTLPQNATFISAFPSQGACANIGGNLLMCDIGSIASGAAAVISIDVQPLSLQPLINTVTANAVDFDPNPTNNTSTEITSTISVGTGIFITPTTNANTLAQFVTAAGAAGLRVTGSNLRAHRSQFGTSSGTFAVGTPPFTYGITRPGIVLSTGAVEDYQSGSNLLSGWTTAFGVTATMAQEALLDPITGAGGNNFRHFDVTQLDIQFDLLPDFDRVEFKVVFGSEEWDEFVGSLFIDGFGIYLNGSNIAFTAGSPININHPDMLDLPGTELDGVLAPGGDAILTFSASLPAESRNNTLTFIVADTSDDLLDTTVYISSLQGGRGPNADLAASVSAVPDPVVVGSNLTYNVSVQNRGPNDTTGVVVRDTLPVGVNFISALPSSGSCVLSNTTVVCALGDMAVSTSRTIAIMVQPSSSGRITNLVSVSSDLADFQAGNDTAAVVSSVNDPGEVFNIEPILLTDAAPALPYPSVVTVSGLPGVVSNVTVSLVDVSHTFPGDLDVMLAGPTGTRVIVMSDAGAGNAVNGVTLKFDDNAAIMLPQLGQIVSGSYRPTDYEPGDTFFAPAPGAPFASTLGAFAGTSPNGVWSLYVSDDRGVDSGIIAGGWRLVVRTMSTPEGPTLSVARVGGSVVISWADTFTGFTLETTTSLAVPALWAPVGVAPVQGGGSYTVTVPIAGGDSFFRLKGP